MSISFKIAILLFFFSQAGLLSSQESFVFPDDRIKDKIKFDLVNNLILIPVQVNNANLVFLLDTGASKTVIFSLEEADSLKLNNASSVKLRGLGGGELVDGILSKNNVIRIGAARKTDQAFYVIFDGTLQLSSRLGVPVHGIIGYDFFKDFVVEINYPKEKLLFTLPDFYKKKKCSSCLEKTIFFTQGKPNLNAVFKNKGLEKEVSLLVDSGSSDALWLFENEANSITVPEEAFEDYLGLGISGSIYGERGKVDQFVLGDFRLDSVHAAYPDITFIKGSEAFHNRNGSIGGEILKRFDMVINYRNKYIRFKKNKYFKEPFHYNMSGLTIEHGSFTVFKEVAQQSIFSLNKNESRDAFTQNLPTRYNFVLERSYRVAEIREGSPAGEAGIEIGDEIVEINGTPAYKYKLHELYELFQSKEGRVINLLISRDNHSFKVKFALKDI